MRTYCIAKGTLYSVLCSNLNGKEIQKKEDICIHIAGTFCTAGTNTTL